MTENQGKTKNETMAEIMSKAIDVLPDEMSDRQITSFFLTICTTYGVSPETVAMICAAMIQTVVGGDYEAVLALAEEECNEEDEG